MPIDPSKALGAELGEGQYSWTQDDVILYHVGIGGDDAVFERTCGGRSHGAPKVPRSDRRIGLRPLSVL